MSVWRDQTGECVAGIRQVSVWRDQTGECVAGLDR